MFRPWYSFFQVPDDRAPWAWGAENIYLKNSPFGNCFRPDLTPWLKEPLEVFPSNHISELTAMCCVQGGKTIMLQVASAWVMRFEPDTMMITCQTDDDAKDFARERLWPMLERIPEISSKLPPDRTKKSLCKISMSDSSVIIHGANRNNLQSKNIRWIFNDEVWLWKTGLLDEARKRGTRYWNRRRVNVSTAGEKGCDLDLAFEAGDKREWNMLCPACNQLNFPKWERIKWPKDAELLVECPDGKGGVTQEPLKLEGGEWNYKAVKYAAYFECEHCGAKHQHTDEIHKRMNAGGKYIATNPNPSPGFVSFRFNALCLSPSEVSWGDLAVEWLKAESEYDKGNEKPRREFIQKRLAESYDANRYVKFERLPSGPVGDWPEESHRFMTVDVQETEFWVVIRAWARTGESRLLWAGRCFTWDELEAKQNEFKVNPACVFVDAGFDQNKVIRECAKRNRLLKVNGRADWFGWKALDGENQESRNFTYKPKNAKSYLLPYSWPPKYLSGNSGTATPTAAYAKLHLWSNRTIKDILIRLREGKGAKWMAYDGAPLDWHQHMFSERRIRTWDKLGHEWVKWERIGKRANHLWDCEAMQVVAACMAQIIGDKIEVEQETVKPEEVSLAE